MADIRIEKKSSSGPNIWPWLLGLLALALVIWLAFEMFDDDDDLDEPVVTEVAPPERSSEIVSDDNTYALVSYRDTALLRQEYDTYLDDYDAYTTTLTGDMGLGHEFSHNALVQLANATAALAAAHSMGEEIDIQRREAMIKEKADAITRDPMATTHGNDIRDAAIAISETLSEVQAKAYPGLDGAVAELGREAEAIEGDDLTLGQKGDVRSFFGSARVALKAMRDYDDQNGRM